MAMASPWTMLWRWYMRRRRGIAPIRPRARALVTIEITEPEPDALKRISLLNGAFLRVATGTRLVEVLDADYQAGYLEFVVDGPRSQPPAVGRVSVRYDEAAV